MVKTTKGPAPWVRPEKKIKTRTIGLSDEDWQALEVLATENQLTRTELIRLIIREALERADSR